MQASTFIQKPSFEDYLETDQLVREKAAAIIKNT
jgi:hypothetical protein